ncbi:alpha-tocopherol transfer protein-like [Drosophila novamexicana]|uniref:alpha-tocopherol transfer protein-like n=1 Tax=Drosophila novamexicana TaxID=47314 RepID=UPI0011E5D7EB|nr:alpha-tocopherol transfer protein-like [Drosophila novamexicana]XP_030570688.1 alpha-tocopherol transfer protein-like [Drosophila novamexicana]
MKETKVLEDSDVSMLSESLLKIAKRELREDKCTREQSLEQLRNWVLKNEDLQNVRCDDTFLLRFLRAKKFSVPMAEQTLLKYLNVRRTFPHMATKLDFLEPRLSDLIEQGYIFAVPKRDKHGRRVVIINAKGLNPKFHTSSDQAKAHFLTYECLMEDQETQITGLSHVGDFAGVTTSHVTNWNPTEFARVFKWGEQSLPMRHKEIHLINVPSTLKWLIDFVKNRVSSKMKNRLNIYGSEKELMKAVDADCLPQEMGGIMPMREMIELWKQELAGKRDLVLALDQSMLLSDRGIQRRSSYNSEKNGTGTNFVSQIESIEGSFRKLEFD